MKSFVLFAFLFNFLYWPALVRAQDSDSVTSSSASVVDTAAATTQAPAATSSSVSLTPEMSASSVSSYFESLATATPQQPGDGPSAGDVGSTAGAGDSEAGASGGSSGGFTLSRGGLIAIIVCISVVVLLGIISSVLFYLAKKRSWEVRKTIRKSARKVADALTPRRSTFPKDVQRPKKGTRGLSRIEEIPNTPKAKTTDIEKGDSKMSSFEMGEPPKKSAWSKKIGR